MTRPARTTAASGGVTSSPMPATSRMPARVISGNGKLPPSGNRKDATRPASAASSGRSVRTGRVRAHARPPSSRNSPASGLASDAPAAAAPASRPPGGYRQQRHRGAGQTQRKRPAAHDQIRDDGGSEPQQRQIVPVPGLPAYQVSHAGRGDDTGHDAHQSGREQAGKRWEEQAVAQQMVARVPLVVPQDEPELLEQPDPVLLGRRIRAAQADPEHQQAQRKCEQPGMADDRTERGPEGKLESVDTTQAESSRALGLKLARKDGVWRGTGGQPGLPGGDAPPADVHNGHTSTFPPGSAPNGQTRPHAACRPAVDAIVAPVVAAAGSARAVSAPAAE